MRLPASEEEAAPLPILQWAPSTSQAHVDAGGQAPSVASTAGHTIRVPSKAGDWWLCAHVPGACGEVEIGREGLSHGCSVQAACPSCHPCGR